VLNRIDIRGNHDYPWFYDWITKGIEVPIWTHQGGLATMESYDFDRKNVPREHKELIENALPYFVDEKNNLYVHGGFNPKVPIENQTPYFLTWDRTLIKYARSHTIKKYNHVFVGHTTTQMIDRTISTPITMRNLTMMDTGGGYIGRLALMDVDTLEYWVSDIQVPYYEPGSVDDDGADDTEEEMAWGGRMA
jgi:serine/threonine protein phosphatase 1